MLTEVKIMAEVNVSHKQSYYDWKEHIMTPTALGDIAFILFIITDSSNRLIILIYYISKYVS